VALGVLVGVLAGSVMTAAAGARRTATSLERLAEAAGTSDALVDAGEGGLATARRIAELPSVSGTFTASLVFAVIDGADIDVALFLPRGESGDRGLERDLLVAGRRPDPERSDEATVSERTSELLGVGVGDPLVIHTLTPEQIEAEEYFPPEGPDVPVTITGITRGPNDLLSRDEGDIMATPALYGEVKGAVDEFATYVAVRLVPGASVDELGDERGESLAHPRPSRPGVVGNLVGIQAMPRLLLVFAALLGLAAVVHALRSTVDRRATDLWTLRALGMTRGSLRVCTVVHAVVLAVVALAVGAPLGLAAGRAAWGAVATSISVAADPLVPPLGVGWVVLAAVVAAAAATLAVRLPGRAPLRDHRT